MVLQGQLDQDDHRTPCEVVFVIEATANIVAHWESIKKNYISKALEFFQEKCSVKGELLSVNSLTKFGLVLFHAADKVHDEITESYFPVSSVTSFIRLLDQIEFAGGAGEHFSHVTEGLATALHYFDDLKIRRRAMSIDTECHCFLITNSPPYQINCLENFEYKGCSSTQLASKMLERNIFLSIICPRHITSIQQLYLNARSENTTPLMNYAQDKRHLVLVSGFHLPTEREPQMITDEEETPAAVSDPISGDPIPVPGQISNLGSEFGTNSPITQPMVSMPDNTSNKLMNNSIDSASSMNSAMPPNRQPPQPVRNINMERPSQHPIQPLNPLKKPTVPSTDPYQSPQPMQMPVQPPAQPRPPNQGPKQIWTGNLDWTDKTKQPHETHKTQCVILQFNNNANANLPDIDTSLWLPTLKLTFLLQAYITNQKVVEVLKTGRQFNFQFSPNGVSQLTQFLQKQSQKHCGLIVVQHQQTNIHEKIDNKYIVVFPTNKQQPDKSPFIGIMPIDGPSFFKAIKSQVNPPQMRNNQPMQNHQHQQQPGMTHMHPQQSTMNAPQQQQQTHLQQNYNQPPTSQYINSNNMMNNYSNQNSMQQQQQSMVSGSIQTRPMHQNTGMIQQQNPGSHQNMVQLPINVQRGVHPKLKMQQPKVLTVPRNNTGNVTITLPTGMNSNPSINVGPRGPMSNMQQPGNMGANKPGMNFSQLQMGSSGQLQQTIVSRPNSSNELKHLLHDNSTSGMGGGMRNNVNNMSQPMQQQSAMQQNFMQQQQQRNNVNMMQQQNQQQRRFPM